MSARSLAAIGLAAGACQADYVHVVVESATTELVGQEWEISVRAYGGGNGVNTSYDTTFEGDGPVYTTDFNLVIDDAPPALDLRVAVLATPGWAADRVIRPPGDGRTLRVL